MSGNNQNVEHISCKHKKREENPNKWNKGELELLRSYKQIGFSVLKDAWLFLVLQDINFKRSMDNVSLTLLHSLVDCSYLGMLVSYC